MRILYHHRTQAEDGQAVHVRALIRAFEEVGHEVREVGLVRHAAGAADSPGDSAGRARWGWVTRLPRFARELAEYGYSGVAKNRILSAAAHFEPDFLYERYAFGNTAGVLAASRLKRPLVLEVNAPLVRELEETRGLSFPGLARRLERFVFSSAEVVCAVSAVLRELLIESGVEPQRVVVTPNGVRLEDFDFGDRDAARRAARAELGLPAEAGAGPVIGFVGYFRTWHRLDVVLRALASSGLESAQLVLVGEGPAGAELETLAREVGVRSRVHLAGARTHAAVPALLPAFDLAVLPAINEYASPLKLHEYMAAGLPVVAPDQPNLREVLTHGEDGWLVPSGDVEAMARALGTLARDRELCLRLGRAARATVDRLGLTWRDNVWRVLDAVARSGEADGQRPTREEGP